MSATHRNATTSPWTEETRAEAIRLVAAGATYEEAGATRSAIGGLIKRAGLAKNPRGFRPEITPEILAQREEAKRIAKRDSKRRVRAAAGITPKQHGEIPSAPFTPRKAAVRVRSTPFHKMNFFHGCAYPVGEDTSYMVYCDNPKQEDSSYCPGHHALTHRRIGKPPVGPIAWGSGDRNHSASREAMAIVDGVSV